MELLKTHLVSVHGHRGSRGTLPENTLAAFEEAHNCGAEYIELDVHLSADDVPIVYHDPSLSARLCVGPHGELLDEPIPIRSLQAREIQQLKIGSVLQRSFPRQKKAVLMPVPTLEDVFQWSTQVGIRVNLEFKIEGVGEKWIPDPAHFARVVIQLAKKYRCFETTLFQSFDPRPLVEIRKTEERAFLSHLFEQKRDFIGEALSVGTNLIGPHHALLDQELMEECQRRGLGVLPWTVNEEEDWLRCLKLGVAGIITDYPKDLIAYLEKQHG